MGSFPSANPSLPTSIPGIYEPPSAVVGVVPIASGGTGQISGPAALAALGGVGTHALKRGTAVANYTSTTASFLAIDSTNLDIAIVVPVGSIAIATFIASFETSAGKTARIGISVDATVTSYVPQLGGLASFTSVALKAVLVGDGSSHTFSPVFYVDSGGTITVVNINESISGAAANSETPLHLVEIFAAT